MHYKKVSREQTFEGAKEKRSRQSDVMSDLENMDVMKGSYSKDELENHQDEGDIEMDLEFINLQRNVIPVSEDFGSLLKMNSREAVI